MLDTVTATLDPVPVPVASLVERDEFGPITGPTGLFTAPIAIAPLVGLDELGRPVGRWAPDGDLL